MPTLWFFGLHQPGALLIKEQIDFTYHTKFSSVQKSVFSVMISFTKAV